MIRNFFFFGYWTYMTMEIVGKNVVFFSYWTYMTMEIFSIDVGFFLAIGLI